MQAGDQRIFLVYSDRIEQRQAPDALCELLYMLLVDLPSSGFYDNLFYFDKHIAHLCLFPT